MSNVVYWTTNIKPMPDIVVANGLSRLEPRVSLKEITGQTYLATRPRPEDEGYHGAAFRLTEQGMQLYLDGIAGPPEGFQVWPDGVPEPANFEPLGEAQGG